MTHEGSTRYRSVGTENRYKGTVNRYEVAAERFASEADDASNATSFEFDNRACGGEPIKVTVGPIEGLREALRAGDTSSTNPVQRAKLRK